MTPDRSPVGPLVAFLRSLPALTLLLLAIPLLAPALTEWVVAPLLPLVRPVASGTDPDSEDLARSLAALRQENARLRELLRELGRLGDHDLPDDGCLARNLGQTPGLFQRALVLDVGRRDHVSRDAVVAHAGNLIGFVDELRAGWSRVRLLADPQLRVTVEIVAGDDRAPPTEGWVRGLAGGRDPAHGDGRVLVHHVPAARRHDIQPGDLVVTNGRDFRAPAGLLVGRVSKVTRGDLFLEIELETPDPSRLPLFRVRPAPDNPFALGDG